VVSKKERAMRNLLGLVLLLLPIAASGCAPASPTYGPCLTDYDCAVRDDRCTAVRSGGRTDAICTHDCRSDADCNGGVCGDDNVCLEACTSDRSCSVAGWVCAVGDQCLPAHPLPPIPTYGSCVFSADCEAVDDCTSISTETGTASVCTYACSADSDCESGGRCLSFDGGARFSCVESCTTSGTCEPGWSCQDLGDERSDVCLPGVPSVPSGTYGSCGDDNDCGIARDACVAITTTATRRMCTYACTADSDCDFRGRCLSFDGGASFQCVESCTSSTTCEPGWSCEEIGDGRSDVCLPGPLASLAGTYETCSVSDDCGDAADGCFGFTGAASICTRACAADSDCPVGGRCLSQDSGASFQCVETCVSETCAAGWSCQNVDARGAACLVGSPGIPAYDECVPGSSPSCASGLSCSTIAVDGASAAMCTMHTCGPGVACPRDIDGMIGECLSFDGGALYTCFEPCSVATDCAPGWTCKGRLADGTTFPPICLPM
jgi:hypothetical protein